MRVIFRGQKKRHSILEAAVSTAIGFVVAFVTNLLVLPFFGLELSFTMNFWLTCIYTLVSVLRGYFVRRLFNYLHLREVLK